MVVLPDGATAPTSEEVRDGFKTIETVDSEVTSSSDIKIDSSGYIHIAYYDTNGDVKYAFHNGSYYDISTVDSVGNVGEGIFGKGLSLAIDSNDYPRISYYDVTNSNLKLATWNGSSWGLETVDNDIYVGRYSSLAISTDGYPRIAYVHADNDYLQYISKGAGGWGIPVEVDTNVSYGSSLSLALESDNTPHIAYYRIGANDLNYASPNIPTWDTEVVDSTSSNVGPNPTLIMDSSNNPHIAYYDLINENIKYAAWNGSSWDIENVNASGDTGATSSLILDSNGYPRISYKEGAFGAETTSLIYAVWNGSSWTRNTIETADDDDMGYGSHIELDSNDNPYISYLDRLSVDFNLKCYRYVNSVSTPLTANILNEFVLSGLIIGEYDIYVVADDDLGNLQDTPTLLNL